MSEIHLWGVRQNNLKGVDIKIPLGSFTVVCGPSGSGKSSLAFETLFAEGQRRYIESLSNYTKQFLQKAPKPDVEGVDNIPPAISIEQKNAVKSSRSTVGTTTELVDYLRLLFEKLGKAYCPDHHIPLEKDSVSLGAQKILREFSGKRGYFLAPVRAEGRALTGKKLHALLLQEGYKRIYIPKKADPVIKKGAKKKTETVLKKEGPQKVYGHVDLGEILELDDPKFKRSGAPKEDFFVVVDRVGFDASEEGRVADSLGQTYLASLKFAAHKASGEAYVVTTDGDQMILSEETSCSICGYSFPNISSRLFSFNSPIGACAKCNGFGNILMVDEAKVIPNPELTLAQGALVPFTMPSASYDRRVMTKYCQKAKIDMHTPWKDLPTEHREAIWEGNKEFFGVKGLFEYLETKKYKMHVRVFIARFKSAFSCPDCKGSRLRGEALRVFVHNENIVNLCSKTVEDLYQLLTSWKWTPYEQEVGGDIFRQIHSRLKFLVEVGVGYLTLDRPTRTLSGGEYQRLMLANQLGMGLSQTLYVLDEPTVGLHPRDNDRLIEILKGLRELGNTLVVVEHDQDVIRSSDYIIEMGPGSGHLGGEVLYSGETEKFYSFEKSNTVRYLLPQKNWVPNRQVRPVDIESYKYKIELIGCSGNNLQDVSVTIPLNRLVTVTGVSGSGKSTLITHTLYPALARALDIEYVAGQPFQELRGEKLVKNVLLIDQSPIGKTARSNPVTYLKIYDAIRTVLASSNEAKAMGYSAGTFSLNVEGGRCPVCKGLGFEVVDMMFMDDIMIPCEACDTKKFRPEVLEVRYKGKNVYDILNMTVQEAMDFFVDYPNIRRPLSVLKEMGLEYVRLGQPANSLSGGESQRLKIARELNNTSQSDTLYILDEPTTGLHFREVDLLLKMLNKLIEAGGSVILIEHNLEVIRSSDYVIDLGPDAGKRGGKLVDFGTPEELMARKKGFTGKYLKTYVESLSGTASVKPSNRKMNEKTT